MSAHTYVATAVHRSAARPALPRWMQFLRLCRCGGGGGLGGLGGGGGGVVGFRIKDLVLRVETFRAYL